MNKVWVNTVGLLSLVSAGAFFLVPGNALADPETPTPSASSTASSVPSGTSTTSLASSAPATSSPATSSYNPYSSSSSPAPAEEEGEEPAATADEEGETPASPASTSSTASPSTSSVAAPPPAPTAKPSTPAQYKAAACTFAREVTAQIANDTKQFNGLAAAEDASWADDELIAAGGTARVGYQTALDKIRSTVPTSGFPSDIVAALTDLAHAAGDWIYLIDDQNGDMIQGAVSEYNDSVARLRTTCE